MKKVITIDQVDPMQLLGANDKNIKVIENFFDVKIVVRGTDIKLDGKKDDLLSIESLLHDMMVTINQKGFVNDRDVQVLINLLENPTDANTSLLKNGDDSVILHTHKGVISARTESQKKYHKSMIDNDIVFAIGPAGTGKTYQAVACAVASLKNKSVNKIVITRPVVEAGERLGFLPGDLKEKIDPYLTPIYDALNEMIPGEKLKKYMSTKIIEIAPLAYMRGRTLHNSFIILDEAQNATDAQMKMFLTRLGATSKCIVTGDVTQVDLPRSQVSGLMNAENILRKVEGIEFIYFNEKDVVRHRLVKEIINAYSEDKK